MKNVKTSNVQKIHIVCAEMSLATRIKTSKLGSQHAVIFDTTGHHTINFGYDQAPHYHHAVQSKVPISLADTDDVSFQFYVSDGDKIGNTWLQFTHAALASAGSTYVRWAAGAPIAIIDRVELKIGTKVVQTLYRDEIAAWILNHRDLSLQTETRWTRRTMLDMSQADRTANSAGAYTFAIPLPFYFAFGGPTHAFPTSKVNQMQIRIKFQALGYGVETDGAAPTSARSSIKLYYEEYGLANPSEHATEMKMLSSPKGIEKVGTQYLAYASTAVGAADTSADIDLKGVNEDNIIAIGFVLRWSAATGSSLVTATGGPYDSMIEVTSFQYKNGAEFVINPMTNDEYKDYVHEQYYSGKYRAIYMYPFAANVQDHYNLHSGIPMRPSISGNPILTVNFTAPGAACEITPILLIQNIYRETLSDVEKVV